jgi:hypothetical protein
MKESENKHAGILTLAGQECAAEPALTPLSILNGQPRLLVVNGYSTSFRWPAMLQRKLDRFFEGLCPVTVTSAVKEYTPIARWMNVETGQPRSAWREVLQPALVSEEHCPVIVLAQQSLQGVYGGPTEGIRNAEDQERIDRGEQVLAQYAGLLLDEGASMVIIASHIYKHPMEPAIENEKYALAQLHAPKVETGPDVWSPTQAHYPAAFASDHVHPNTMGAEIMAQGWFECLLEREGLDTPEWSQQELREVLEGGC